MQKRQVISEQEDKQKAGQKAKQNVAEQPCEIGEEILIKIAEILTREKLLTVQEGLLFEQRIRKG